MDDRREDSIIILHRHSGVIEVVFQERYPLVNSVQVRQRRAIERGYSILHEKWPFYSLQAIHVTESNWHACDKRERYRLDGLGQQRRRCRYRQSGDGKSILATAWRVNKSPGASVIVIAAVHR